MEYLCLEMGRDLYSRNELIYFKLIGSTAYFHLSYSITTECSGIPTSSLNQSWALCHKGLIWSIESVISMGLLWIAQTKDWLYFFMKQGPGIYLCKMWSYAISAWMYSNYNTLYPASYCMFPIVQLSYSTTVYHVPHGSGSVLYLSSLNCCQVFK